MARQARGRLALVLAALTLLAVLAGYSWGQLLWPIDTGAPPTPAERVTILGP